MRSVYRNEGGGQPWANRLAEEGLLVYILKLRDRCRSGLSGSPGKRVLGKTNRGFESLPVRTLVRTGCTASQRGCADGAGAGLRGRIARARSPQIHQPRGVTAKFSGRQGNNPDRDLSLKNGAIPPCPTLLRTKRFAMALQHRPLGTTAPTKRKYPC